ncbi:MAG TPA: hypothetical protein PKN32_06300 [Bacteroidales bacterium]|nr:hypothetical protein [Bacteroidales bacterium]
MNKRNVLGILVSVGVIAFLSMFIGSIYYNFKLEEEINYRDVQIKQLLEHVNTIDSIIGYSYDSINDSFSFSYRLKDGEALTYRQAISENDSLSIQNINLLIMEIDQRTAIAYYETVLKLLNAKYGFNLKFDADLNLNPEDFTSKTIDSALLLLPYYRENLQYDRKTNSWLVIKNNVIFKHIDRKNN